MPDTQHQYDYSHIFDFADDTPIAYAIFPELTEFWTLQCLADASGIFKVSNTLIQKI